MTTFKCKFSAVKNGKMVKRTFQVKARDQYEAVDAIVEKIGVEYKDMFSPVFRFGKSASKMSAAVRAAVEGAGPEEEEQS